MLNLFGHSHLIISVLYAWLDAIDILVRADGFDFGGKGIKFVLTCRPKLLLLGFWSLCPLASFGDISNLTYGAFMVCNPDVGLY